MRRNIQISVAGCTFFSLAISCVVPALAADEPQPRILFKPGEALSVDAATEDIAPTYDVALAEKQKEAYPDSPEASFILAVALTRTSRVEEALKEVQRARRLASDKGGTAYFDKMIATYEKMLTAYPDDNRVRYGLAWAYYMKAYLLAQHSRKVAKWRAANPELAAQQDAAAAKAAGQQQAAPVTTAPAAGTTASGTTASATAAPATAATGTAATAAPVTTGDINGKEIIKALTSPPAAAAATLTGLAASAIASSANGKTSALSNVPHIPGALENVMPADVPQIKACFEQALKKIDEILQREPDDIWTIIYGAHLKAEYTGNLDEAMKTWRAVAAKHPNNPGPYFFLGEGYLKQGNLKESINNVSRAIALRALGN